MYDPETYWPERYRRQGPSYVARGGRPDVAQQQVEAVTPYFEHLPSEGRVLDFGCGPGRFRPSLEARGLDYEGVDLIPELGTMEVEDIRPGSFDTAVAIFVLQHIVDERDYESSVARLWRALMPGGVLLVVDHHPTPEPDPHMHPRGPWRLWEVWDMLHGCPLPPVPSVQPLDRNHWLGTLEKGDP